LAICSVLPARTFFDDPVEVASGRLDERLRGVASSMADPWPPASELFPEI
jgi:hypothetical protein